MTQLGELTFWRDVFAEFVATFFLTSVQCALPLTWTASTKFQLTSDGKNSTGEAFVASEATSGGPIQTGLGMGFVVAALAETFGPMSGAHMNPAVTVAMAFSRKIQLTKAIFYVPSQCVGGIAGAAFVFLVTPSSKRDGLAVTTLHADVQWYQGVLIELWLTCLLVSVIFGATDMKRRNVYMASIPIGLTVALDIMCGFNHTGGSMNPARSLGPAVVMANYKDHYIYWVGPILGGVLAALIYPLGLAKISDGKSPADAKLPETHENSKL